MARDRLEPWFPVSSTTQCVRPPCILFLQVKGCKCHNVYLTWNKLLHWCSSPSAVLLWPTEGAFCSVLACIASPFCVKLKMWSHISSPVLFCLGWCIDPRWDLVCTIHIWQLNDSLPHLLVLPPTSERSVVA